MSNSNLTNLFKLPSFQESLHCCKLLVTLSEYNRQHILKLFNNYKINETKLEDIESLVQINKEHNHIHFNNERTEHNNTLTDIIKTRETNDFKLNIIRDEEDEEI